MYDLRSLEDWDNIRGPNFSLSNEDFGTLDERLTSAFQHLILPHDWNLLGDTSAGRYNLSDGTLCAQYHLCSRVWHGTGIWLLALYVHEQI